VNPYLRPLLALLAVGVPLLAGCTTGRTTGGDGTGGEEGSGNGNASGAGNGSGNGTEGAGSSGDTATDSPPSEGESSGESSSSGSSGSSSSGSSGSSSSGSSGSTPPRPACVAWANRHCACLEAANAAAANCRTKGAQGCEDAITLCPAQLSWYTCSQVTCGKTCPNPGC
jgi:hypothetical protein